MVTMNKINRPIRFFGLTPMQFSLFVVSVAILIIISVFAQLPPITVIGGGSFIFFISKSLFRTLNKEHKAGNPNYLESLSVRTSTPSEIVDKHHIFNKILK